MKTLQDLREEREQLDERTSASDIPFILVLKRQSIRQYPDGQTVALYYNDRLKRYIAVPFGGKNIIDAGPEVP